MEIPNIVFKQSIDYSHYQTYSLSVCGAAQSCKCVYDTPTLQRCNPIIPRLKLIKLFCQLVLHVVQTC